MPIMFIYRAAKHKNTGTMSGALLDVAEVEGFGG